MDIRKRPLSEEELLNEEIAEGNCIGGFRYVGMNTPVRYETVGQGYSDGMYWKWMSEGCYYINPLTGEDIDYPYGYSLAGSELSQTERSYLIDDPDFTREALSLADNLRLMVIGMSMKE